jgi:hypothetical protein
MKKWYWSGYLIREEREWPSDDLPPEVEPMPKWVLTLAVLAVALMMAYATYGFLVT